MYQRDLSCFLCQELMYEYLVQSLDVKRSDAVARHLEACDKCKIQYKLLLSSQEYLDSLAETKVAPDFLAKITKPSTSVVANSKIPKWKKLPDPIRWSIESLVVGGIFALLFTLITNTILTNKEKIESADITLAEISKPNLDETTSTDSILEPSPVSVAENKKQNEETLEQNQKHNSDQPAKTIAQNNSTDIPPAPQQEPPKTNTTQSKAAATNRKGYVFRANMVTSELTKVTNEIVTRIESVGGKKAGEVKLGWERKNGNYFHFTIPESDQEAFFSFLRSYGPIHISKDPHPRVMPVGTIRMILWVRNNQVPPTNSVPSSDSQGVDAEESPTEENEGS